METLVSTALADGKIQAKVISKIIAGYRTKIECKQKSAVKGVDCKIRDNLNNNNAINSTRHVLTAAAAISTTNDAATATRFTAAVTSAAAANDATTTTAAAAKHGHSCRRSIIVGR